jgi:hypothetical protein
LGIYYSAPRPTEVDGVDQTPCSEALRPTASEGVDSHNRFPNPGAQVRLLPGAQVWQLTGLS